MSYGLSEYGDNYGDVGADEINLTGQSTVIATAAGSITVITPTGYGLSEYGDNYGDVEVTQVILTGSSVAVATATGSLSTPTPPPVGVGSLTIGGDDVDAVTIDGESVTEITIDGDVLWESVVPRPVTGSSFASCSATGELQVDTGFEILTGSSSAICTASGELSATAPVTVMDDFESYVSDENLRNHYVEFTEDLLTLDTEEPMQGDQSVRYEGSNAAILADESTHPHPYTPHNRRYEILMRPGHSYSRPRFILQGQGMGDLHNDGVYYITLEPDTNRFRVESYFNDERVDNYTRTVPDEIEVMETYKVRVDMSKEDDVVNLDVSVFDTSNVLLASDDFDMIVTLDDGVFGFRSGIDDSIHNASAWDYVTRRGIGFDVTPSNLTGSSSAECTATGQLSVTGTQSLTGTSSAVCTATGQLSLELTFKILEDFESYADTQELKEAYSGLAEDDIILVTQGALEGTRSLEIDRNNSVTFPDTDFHDRDTPNNRRYGVLMRQGHSNSDPKFLLHVQGVPAYGTAAYAIKMEPFANRFRVEGWENGEVVDMYTYTVPGGLNQGETYRFQVDSLMDGNGDVTIEVTIFDTNDNALVSNDFAMDLSLADGYFAFRSGNDDGDESNQSTFDYVTRGPLE